MDSILISVKKLLGINDDYCVFDSDIVFHINSAISSLVQLGIEKSDFHVQGQNETWSEFLGNDPKLDMVKQYIFFKVRMAFDPPTSSAVIEAINKQINELEWRINVASGK